MTDDTTGALASLEALGPVAGVPPVADGEPTTELEAVARWLAECRLERGAVKGPSPTAMVLAYEVHARQRGWELDTMTASAMGAALRRLGYRRTRGTQASAYRFTRAAADVLWRHAPAPPPRAPRKRVAQLPRDAARRTAHPKTRPVRTCDGREWHSTRALARALGVSSWAVTRAITRAGVISGLHVSYLTKDSRRSGTSGTVSVHDDGHQDGSGI